ncbi:Short neurotoxin 1 [Trichuris trichiura]|uniref:Short neurotoxin 1 n=1 Tax=Trichuris trichiura TaxID=36087 RepID=A0A077ZMD5_TRITR|nr:Short neurotoxin 1 [Trichuris trichiura]
MWISTEDENQAESLVKCTGTDKKESGYKRGLEDHLGAVTRKGARCL